MATKPKTNPGALTAPFGSPLRTPVAQDQAIRTLSVDSLSSRPPAAVFGKGQCQIGPNLYYSDGSVWHNANIQSFDVLSQLPAASTFGPGFAQVGGDLYVVNNGNAAPIIESYGKTKTGKVSSGIVVGDFSSGTTGLAASSVTGNAVISNKVDGGINTINISDAVAQAYSTPGSWSIDKLVTPFLYTNNTVITITLLAHAPFMASISNLSMYIANTATGFSDFLQGSILPKNMPEGYPYAADDGGLVILEFSTKNLTVKTGTLIDVGSVINKIRLTSATYQGTNCSLIDVRIGRKSIATMPIYFDDGWTSEYTEAFHYMAEKNIKGTIAVISSVVGDASHCSLAQLHEMYNAGWDIVNHSHTHIYAAGNNESMTQIALAQTVAAGGNFVLNGTVAASVFDQPRTLVMNNPTGTVGLSIYVINGVDENGTAVTERFSAPNLNTYVLGKTVWSKINYITAVHGTVTGTPSIGYGKSYNELYYDYKTCRDFLLTNGFYRSANYVVIPGGMTTPILYRVFADLGVIAARNTADKPDYPFEQPDRYRMHSGIGGKIDAGASSVAITWKNHVVNKNLMLSMFLHDVSFNTTAADTTKSGSYGVDFKLFIDSVALDVQSNKLFCPTMSEYARFCGY